MYAQYSKMISLFLEINPTPSDAQFHALAEACGTDKETLEAISYRMLAELEREERDEYEDEGLEADVSDLVPDEDLPEDDTPALAEPPTEQEEVEDENSETFNEQGLGDEEEGDTLIAAVCSTCHAEPCECGSSDIGLLAALTPGVDDMDLTIDERAVSDNIGQDTLTYKDAAASDGSLDPADSTEVQEDTYSDGSATPFDKGPTIKDGPVVPSITKRKPEDNITARVLARLAQAQAR